MIEMYQEAILDHYRNPRNFGHLENPDIVSRDVNTSCGDEIEFQLSVKDGVVEDVRFSGEGCAISRAAASMLSELVKGKRVEEVAKINKEDVISLLSIPISPMRLKCALLGFKVLKVGIIKYLGGNDG
ncbi:SUF system NifU family Fe-S cluster assembly protein [Candidatus Woesearchaeota archaeon]|nr:MAG: SUF system NifU family Fe-S cluster assembly protein [Candidatus Woesearchaeota archaeon]